MRRNPGDWLQETLLNRLAFALATITMGLGMLIGAASSIWMSSGPALPLVAGVVILAIGFGVLVSRGEHKAERGRLSHLKKGLRAETRVGQVIEFALTDRRCAVAHGVFEIASVGDIDHLVATPAGLWVVETKHGRLPERAFAETLKRIAANVQAIRQWAPGVRVSGCLVFGGENARRVRPTYASGPETIVCFKDPQALLRKLRDERRATGSLSAKLIRRVWRLGHMSDLPSRPDWH